MNILPINMVELFSRPDWLDYQNLEKYCFMPPKSSISPKISVPLLIVTLLWLCCAIGGFACLGKRDQTAGAAAHPPAQWQLSSVPLDPVKPTLVMLVHPQCPCSRASLSELNHLMALCPNCAAVFVLFLKPPGCTQAWVKTDLWRQASAIPGIKVCVDENGEAARRFGAATSGETLLYAPSGRLLYGGGLTGARGHEGDNAGLSAVAALLEDVPDARSKAKLVQEPVYGCPLYSCTHTACRTKTLGKGGASWLP